MLGYIYVWSAKGHLNPFRPDNWFTILQVIITRTPYRHTSWGVGDIFIDGTDWQVEADLCVAMTPIAPVGCRIFKINATDPFLHDLAAALAAKYSGRTYGFLSLVNFAGRALVSLFGGDGRKFCPIRYGDVCSALVYAGLQNLAQLQKWPDVTKFLNQYHRNCFQPSDVMTVCKAFPEHFTEVQP
jgi:hypothetical protein